MKKFKTILIGISIALALSLMGCAERPVFKLDSMENEVDYYNGNQVVSWEDDYAVTSLEFIEQNGVEFVFYVYALNKDDEKILFKPDDIIVEVLEKNSIEGDYPSIVNVKDPERQIKSIEKSMQDRESDHDVETGLNAIFGLFSVTAEIIENDPDEAVFEAAVWADNQVRDNYEYEYDMDNMRMAKSFWKNEALRKTTLGKDEEIGGIIHVSVIENARKIKVTVPVGNTFHEYYYLQKQIN